MPDYTGWLNASPDSRDDKLFAELYAELHRIAQGRMVAERRDRTLNAVGLVHEAWLRLEKTAPEKWRDRRQFFAAATEAMRRILVEAARRRMAAKRGGSREPVPFEDDLPIQTAVADERLLGIHEVLDQLGEESGVDAQIVKLRFFGGMSHKEIATLLEMSERAVERRWTLAKVWLYRALKR